VRTRGVVPAFRSGYPLRPMLGTSSETIASAPAGHDSVQPGEPWPN
jgi:hypothetical protein